MSLKIIPMVLVALVAAYLVALSISTRHTRVKPEGQRQLDPCPDKPYCVTSFPGQQEHSIEPFVLIDNNRPRSWQRLRAAVVKSGGEIVIDDGRYCHAVYTSRLFRFKDDFEAVLNDRQIDIRSASRAGTSDLGQNRKRVEEIRQLYEVTAPKT